MFLCPEQKGPYMHLVSPLHWLFLQKEKQELGGAPLMRNVSLRRPGEEAVWEWGTRDKSKWIRLSLTPAEGFTGCPECHIRIILGKKKTPGISNLSWSLFPFQLILMLVQSYLNANFFFLWVWNGQKPPNGLREITWKILLLKTREWALPWSDWGIEFYRYVCARIREYRFITQIWRQPEGESELSLFYICYYRQTEHPHQFSLGYPVSLSPVISWK